MPHCVIEYSKPVNQQVQTNSLLNAVYEGALTCQLFKAEDVKCRAVAFEDCLQPGAVEDFVHVAIYILDGRSLAQKQQLSEAILAALKGLEIKGCVLTVDIRDIEAACYGKAITQP